MLAKDQTGWLRWLPGLHVLLHYELTWLAHDLMAGLALTAVLVPVGIAYAVASACPVFVAGTPPLALAIGTGMLLTILFLTRYPRLPGILIAVAGASRYPLNQDPRRRTFGNVIRAWEDNGAPRPEVAAIWADLKAMHEVRNFVHLHKVAQNADAAWEKVLQSEQDLLQGALNAIAHVSKI